MATYKITVDYNPNVTLEFIEEVAKESFPDCKIGRFWFINFGSVVYIRQDRLVQADIAVKQKKSSKKTVIKIGMDLKPSTKMWLPVIHYIMHIHRRGDFGEQVEDAIRDGLRNKLGIRW